MPQKCIRHVAYKPYEQTSSFFLNSLVQVYQIKTQLTFNLNSYTTSAVKYTFYIKKAEKCTRLSHKV